MKARGPAGPKPVEVPATGRRGGVARDAGFRADLGNRATLDLLAGSGVQAKLRVPGPENPLEREADRVADSVVSAPEGVAPVRVRAAAKVPGSREKGFPPTVGSGEVMPPEGLPEREEEEPRQDETSPPPLAKRATAASPAPPAGGGSAASQAPGAVPGPGLPLGGGQRAFFEPRLGADLGGVRVHTGDGAARSAASLGARAFTRGRHLVFGRGEYQPATASGRRLLAHELVHTVQQGAVRQRPAAPEAGAGRDPGSDKEPGVVDQLGDSSPLSSTVRSRMEQGLGRSLGDVRLHTGPEADRLARPLGARAFTLGRHVAFRRGAYRPGTVAGDVLLAHELAHTVQQRAAVDEAPAGPFRNDDVALERDADSAAVGAAAALWAPGRPRRPARGPRRRGGLRLSRCSSGATKETTTKQVGKHTTVNYILDKLAPKRSNTDPSTVDLKGDTFTGSVHQDKAAKQWKYRLDSVDSKGEMQLVYYTKDHYPAPTPEDDSGELSNVTQNNWKTIVNDLESNKTGVPKFWSAYRREITHESFHWRNEWQVDSAAEIANAEADVDKLALPEADAADAAAAEAKLKPQASTIFTTAMGKAGAKFWARGDSPGDPPYQAQAPACQALADRVKNHANTKKWK